MAKKGKKKSSRTGNKRSNAKEFTKKQVEDIVKNIKDISKGGQDINKELEKVQNGERRINTTLKATKTNQPKIERNTREIKDISKKNNKELKKLVENNEKLVEKIQGLKIKKSEGEKGSDEDPDYDYMEKFEKHTSKLTENFVKFQKLTADMTSKFDNLTHQISSLLELFEESAKKVSEQSGDSKTTKKLNKLLDQNKLIAKGITLIESNLRNNKESSEEFLQDQIQQVPAPQAPQPPAPQKPQNKPPQGGGSVKNKGQQFNQSLADKNTSQETNTKPQPQKPEENQNSENASNPQESINNSGG